jgi:hypothetical protein
MNALSINDEWENFMSFNGEDEMEDFDVDGGNHGEILSNNITGEFCPKASPIYISTKTNIAYLNQMIDLKTVFWKIPILPYALPEEGVIKKQMKMNSLTMEELEDIQERVKNETYVEENVITSINNPTGRIKFKDIRKVSIGISKKDLVSYRCKKKSAFYNCFVLILRIKLSDMFKEFHVKVFNTGKLEIPGIQDDVTFQKILDMVINILDPHVSSKRATGEILKLQYQENTVETVLINSNFSCGFYINRETLFETLKYKYKIQCIYDPCSYPGIQCKFYYNKENGIQTGIQSMDEIAEEKLNENGEPILSTKKLSKAKLKATKNKNDIPVSFMIFRTGSVLIVGKCDESILHAIYEFLKSLLITEFSSIMLKISEDVVVKEKKKKLIRKEITVGTGSLLA